MTIARRFIDNNKTEIWKLKLSLRRKSKFWKKAVNAVKNIGISKVGISKEIWPKEMY